LLISETVHVRDVSGVFDADPDPVSNVMAAEIPDTGYRSARNVSLLTPEPFT